MEVTGTTTKIFDQAVVHPEEEIVVLVCSKVDRLAADQLRVRVAAFGMPQGVEVGKRLQAQPSADACNPPQVLAGESGGPRWIRTRSLTHVGSELEEYGAELQHRHRPEHIANGPGVVRPCKLKCDCPERVVRPIAHHHPGHRPPLPRLLCCVGPCQPQHAPRSVKQSRNVPGRNRDSPPRHLEKIPLGPQRHVIGQHKGNRRVGVLAAGRDAEQRANLRQQQLTHGARQLGRGDTQYTAENERLTLSALTGVRNDQRQLVDRWRQAGRPACSTLPCGGGGRHGSPATRHEQQRPHSHHRHLA